MSCVLVYNMFCTICAGLQEFTRITFLSVHTGSVNAVFVPARISQIYPLLQKYNNLNLLTMLSLSGKNIDIYIKKNSLKKIIFTNVTEFTQLVKGELIFEIITLSKLLSRCFICEIHLFLLLHILILIKFRFIQTAGPLSNHLFLRGHKNVQQLCYHDNSQSRHWKPND